MMFMYEFEYVQYQYHSGVVYVLVQQQHALQLYLVYTTSEFM